MTEKTTIPLLPDNQFKQILFGENDWKESEQRLLKIFEEKRLENPILKDLDEEKPDFSYLFLFFILQEDFQRYYRKFNSRELKGNQVFQAKLDILEQSFIEISGDDNVIEKLKAVKISKVYTYTFKKVFDFLIMFKGFFP